MLFPLKKYLILFYEFHHNTLTIFNKLHILPQTTNI